MVAQRSLAELLRSLRLSADLTLEGLAERSGVSVRTLSDIERGVSAAPQARTISAIVQGLGLSGADEDAVRRAARGRHGSGEEDSGTTTAPPHRVADFTGREQVIAEVLALLEAPAVEASVVVLCGAPGVGKTTSALEAISRVRSPEPPLWVDLDGFSAHPLTPVQILRRLLRQMPALGDTVPAEFDEAARLWTAATREHPPIVLLDNAANESQVRAVLSLNPLGRVIVTSRRSLAGLESAHRVTLGPLTPDESVGLLRRLIPEAQRRVGDLRELARLCDHIPLALRIAGNRIASSPARQTGDFVDRMRLQGNRLRMLVAGDLAVESAFALSYDELEPRTAAVFRAVSIVDGATFDARIAAAIADTDLLETEDRLDQLTDLGLLEARGGNRYRLHDLVRLFAFARLTAELGQVGVVSLESTLRSWLLGTLERAGAWFEPERSPELISRNGMSFPDAETAEAWIRREEPHWWPAMRSAASTGDNAMIVDVADSLHWFSELWADWGHWQEFFSLAVASSRVLRDSRLEAMHLGYLVWASWIEGSGTEQSLAIARDAVRAAEASGDDQQLGWSNLYLGSTLRRGRMYPEGLAAARASLTAFRSTLDPDGTAQAMLLLAQFHDLTGDHESAIRDFRQVLDKPATTSSAAHLLVQRVTRLTAYQIMSRSLSVLERHGEAIDAATMGIDTARAFGTASRTASALRVRALAHVAAGDLDAASADVTDALAELGEYGEDPFLMAGRTKAALEELQKEIAARRA